MTRSSRACKNKPDVCPAVSTIHHYWQFFCVDLSTRRVLRSARSHGKIVPSNKNCCETPTAVQKAYLVHAKYLRTGNIFAAAFGPELCCREEVPRVHIWYLVDANELTTRFSATWRVHDDSLPGDICSLSKHAHCYQRIDTVLILSMPPFTSTNSPATEITVHLHVIVGEK